MRYSTIGTIAVTFLFVGCGSSSSGASSGNGDALEGSLFERPLPAVTGLATVNASGLHIDLSNRELVCGKPQEPNADGLINIGINAPSPEVAPGVHAIAANKTTSTFAMSGLSVARGADGRAQPQQVVASGGKVEVLRNDATTFSARITTTDRMLNLSGVFSVPKCVVP